METDFLLSVGSESDYQSEKEKKEQESADASCYVPVSYIERQVVAQRNLTFYYCLLPPWSRLQDFS